MPLVALVALLCFAGGGSGSTMLQCYSRSLVAVLALYSALPVVVLYFATVLVVAVVLWQCAGGSMLWHYAGGSGGGGAADGQRPHALQPMFHNYIVQCTTIHAALHVPTTRCWTSVQPKHFTSGRGCSQRHFQSWPNYRQHQHPAGGGEDR